MSQLLSYITSWWRQQEDRPPEFKRNQCIYTLSSAGVLEYMEHLQHTHMPSSRIKQLDRNCTPTPHKHP